MNAKTLIQVIVGVALAGSHHAPAGACLNVVLERLMQDPQ